MLRIAFLGYGSIAELIHAELKNGYRIIGYVGRSSRRAVASTTAPPPFQEISEMLAAAPDLVVEAASVDAARRHVPTILREGIDVVSLSVGAYLDEETLAQVRRAKGGRLFLPSGALPGVDLVKAAAVGGITSVLLTTRKHPTSLAGAPGIRALNVDVEKVTTATCVFDGSASEAIRLFPSNVNVSAALSLAGVGASRTRVRIIADPNVKTNEHRLLVRGAFGQFDGTVNNVPASNLRSSTLAAHSAVALIRQLSEPIVLGT